MPYYEIAIIAFFPPFVPILGLREGCDYNMQIGNVCSDHDHMDHSLGIFLSSERPCEK